MRVRERGFVVSVDAERPGAQEVSVRVGDLVRRAVNYVELTGAVKPEDEVYLNTWAVEMCLGTGGVDFVAQVAGRVADAVPPGHIMKLRYTPAQLPVMAAESPESPYHQELCDFQKLDGIPVVCAELHSQVAAVCAAVKWETRGAARIAYVMTDGASLPLAFSRLVPALRANGLIDATITCGQAFGGDFEAVNVYSALAVARVAAKADVIVVAQGPGNAGTATPFGFSGLEQGIALNAVLALGGTAIAVARLSFADPRPRHLGLSHHTATVLGRVVMRSVLVPIPRLEPDERTLLRKDLEDTGLLDRHEFITVDSEQGLKALLSTGLHVTTMGRTVDEERPFFLSGAAAGLIAGQWHVGAADEAELL